ncbi:MAG TPA: ATP-binding protein [Saprospiraceae bacterium]|nr:ATP-binding protein [Saprospiraceae bacterium]
MNKFITNPFDRSALTDAKLLAGRSSEFRQIRFLLRNAFKQENRIKSMMICGDRGVGKTSLLNLIEIECSANNIIPIRLNLTLSNSHNSNELFWYLFSQTINTVFGLGLLGGKGGDIQNAIQKIIISDGLTDIINWIFKTPILHKNYLMNKNSTFEFDLLIEDLKLLRLQIANSNIEGYNQKTKFLFLVDESQNIYSNAKIIEEIRFIIQNQDLGYGFVFAGDTSFEKSQWDIVFGGTHREFDIINLDYFDDLDSVKEYFSKSLESIEWTTKEIESELFYRFHHACGQIHALTSGKPAWINEIAQKMFERCMKGESSVLRFDRNAQNDVKQILQSSGQIDKVKLDFIDSLSPKYQKWLSKIFSSEISTLRQVYFFSKFILSGEYILSLEEYKSFCNSLIDSGIVILQQFSESGKSIGYKSEGKTDDLLDTPYLTFGENSDSIKLWLQINSDGKYRFRFVSPDITFIEYINGEITSISGNSFILSSEFTNNINEEEFRLSTIIEKINKNSFDIIETPYSIINVLYKLIKRLIKSKKKQILFIQLKDNISGKIKSWNVYNINEHDQLIEFYDNKIRLQKLKSNVENYNSKESNYSLEITIENVIEPSIERFQDSIIKSGDSKKRSIVIEDKMQALIKYYIKENDVKSSYEVASFIYNLYEEGHDLSIYHLNNTAYVLLAKEEDEKATALLKEAIKKINNEILEQDEYDSAVIIFYNLAIIIFKEGNYENAIKAFKLVGQFCEDHENIDDSAAVLFVISIDKEMPLLKEIHGGDTKNTALSVKAKAIENILLLEKYLGKLETNG